jgi:hypothetical protein
MFNGLFMITYIFQGPKDTWSMSHHQIQSWASAWSGTYGPEVLPPSDQHRAAYTVWNIQLTGQLALSI